MIFGPRVPLMYFPLLHSHIAEKLFLLWEGIHNVINLVMWVGLGHVVLMLIIFGSFMS